MILQNAGDDLLNQMAVQQLMDELVKHRLVEKTDQKQIAIYEKLMRGQEVHKSSMIDFTTAYVNEQDRNLGDQVLVFPNPDHPCYQKKYVRLVDAFLVLDTCFKFSSDALGLAFRNNFSEAFLRVFMTLGKIKSDDKEARPFSDFSKRGKVSSKILEKFQHLELKPMIKRQVCRGGYHKPDEENTLLWRKQNPPDHVTNDDGEQEVIEHGDFMTLLRNAIFIKLSE